MRFANMPRIPSTSKAEEQRTAASDFIRRIVSAPSLVPLPQAAPAAKVQDLPLDQRVRLVGEW